MNSSLKTTRFPRNQWFSIPKENNKVWKALNVYFSNILWCEQKLPLQTRADNQGNQNEGCWLEVFHLLIETKKSTGFTSLRVNCREIIQVTPWIFSTKFAKNGTSDYDHRFLHIRNSVVIKFHSPIEKPLNRAQPRINSSNSKVDIIRSQILCRITLKVQKLRCFYCRTLFFEIGKVCVFEQ